MLATDNAALTSGFPDGTGTILLTEVGCTGSESSLSDCTSLDINICTHSQDAGVRCGPLRKYIVH